MKSSGNQVLVLIIGLLLGAMAGGGVAWYFMGNTGKNIIIVNNAPEETGKSDEKSKKTSGKKSKVTPSKTTTEKNTDNSENSLTDSLSSDNMEISSERGLIEEGKTLLSDNVKDTLGNDSLKIANLQEENIIVKKDELLYSKNFPVYDLTKVEASNKKDSLLQILRGAKDPAPSNFIVVEYWKSPINYKGYKMGKNKMILFGLLFSEKAEVYRLNDVLYLKNNDKTYRMQNSLEFKSYETVTDPGIINQLVNK